MKLSEETIRKWVNVISDDYMHYTDEQKEYAIMLAKSCDYEILPDDVGVIGWLTVVDFDCKRKTNVLLFYCRPEGRGHYLRYMFRRVEEIARQEGACEIVIGCSTSGYKEDSFNRVVQYMGYGPYGYSKRIE